MTRIVAVVMSALLLVATCAAGPAGKAGLGPPAPGHAVRVGIEGKAWGKHR